MALLPNLDPNGQVLPPTAPSGTLGGVIPGGPTHSLMSGNGSPINSSSSLNVPVTGNIINPAVGSLGTLDSSGQMPGAYNSGSMGPGVGLGAQFGAPSQLPTLPPSNVPVATGGKTAANISIDSGTGVPNGTIKVPTKPVTTAQTVPVPPTAVNPNNPSTLMNGAPNPNWTGGTSGTAAPLGTIGNPTTTTSGYDPLSTDQQTLFASGGYTNEQLRSMSQDQINAALSIHGLTSSNNNPIDSTTGLRMADQAANNKQAADLAQRAVDLSQGKFSDADQARINAAGEAVAGQFDVMLNQANINKTTGMGQAVVGAGQHGGLMNSQYAGAAALPGNQVAPNQGASGLPGATSGFVGAGGQFEKIQSAYDNTIAQLNAQKAAAVQSAKLAMQDALSTGNSNAFAAVQKMITSAQDQYKTGLAGANDQVTTATNAFNLQQSKMAGAAASMLSLDAQGNLGTQPTQAQVYQAAVQGGYDPTLFAGMVNQQYQALQKQSTGVALTAAEAQQALWGGAQNNPNIPISLNEYQALSASGLPGSLNIKPDMTLGQARDVMNAGGGFTGMGGTSGTVGSGGEGTSNNQGQDIIQLLSTAPGLDNKDVMRISPVINAQVQHGYIQDAKDTLKPLLYNSIKNGTDKQAVSDYNTSISSLNHLQDLLNQYAAAGGKTNLLSGTVENFAENVLKTTNNPALAKIATSITDATNNYRHANFGARFTEAEQSLVESVLPSTKNVPELNAQRIAGMIAGQEEHKASILKTNLGDRTYNTIWGNGSTSGGGSSNATSLDQIDFGI